MKEPFSFYRALDAMKGSWDGYGFFALNGSDFLAFVADAPSGASIHTPEVIRNFWAETAKQISDDDETILTIRLADAINRLQTHLQKLGRSEGAVYQSTLALVLKRNSNLYYIAIGDSAVRLYRNNRIHHLGGSQVWDGALIMDSTRSVAERQSVGQLQFIGNDGDFVSASRIGTMSLQSGDMLLLHSDGFEDIVSPDRILQLLSQKPPALRAEIETLFRQQQIKDDVTLLAMAVEVPAAFDAQHELNKLAAEIGTIRKEQSEIHRHLREVSALSARMERLETNLRNVSRQIQNQPRRTESYIAPASISKPAVRPWMNVWVVVILLLALAVTAAAFYYSRAERTPVATAGPRPAPAETAVPKQPPAQVINPPEIAPAEDCSYIVQKGDTLQKIGDKKGVSVEQLKQWNPTVSKDPLIRVGQKLDLCGGNDEIP